MNNIHLIEIQNFGCKFINVLLIFIVSTNMLVSQTKEFEEPFYIDPQYRIKLFEKNIDSVEIWYYSTKDENSLKPLFDSLNTGLTTLKEKEFESYLKVYFKNDTLSYIENYDNNDNKYEYTWNRKVTLDKNKIICEDWSSFLKSRYTNTIWTNNFWIRHYATNIFVDSLGQIINIENDFEYIDTKNNYVRNLEKEEDLTWLYSKHHQDIKGNTVRKAHIFKINKYGYRIHSEHFLKLNFKEQKDYNNSGELTYRSLSYNDRIKPRFKIHNNQCGDWTTIIYHKWGLVQRKIYYKE